MDKELYMKATQIESKSADFTLHISNDVKPAVTTQNFQASVKTGASLKRELEPRANAQVTKYEPTIEMTHRDHKFSAYMTHHNITYQRLSD